MLLPKTVEYALRAMAHMATLPVGTACPSADLAAAAAIPPHYVSKLMRRLVVADLVLSKRGHGGGFTLSRAPDEIYFIQILDALAFDGDSQRCLFGWAVCDPAKPCPLHPAWVALKSAFLTWASETTLGDVREGWVPPI